MLEGIPFYVYALFLAAVAVTFVLLLGAVRQASARGAALVGAALVVWLGLQAWLAQSNFYHNYTALPPRFIFAVGPALLAIALLFVFKRRDLARLPLFWLTLLNVVRVPVELVLHALAQAKLVPWLMTYEGRNFDILTGLTAPLICWLAWRGGTIKRGWLAAWHAAGLLLLINIVANAVLSLPYPLQRFAFDQPNRAVLYFPFIWLPAFIVPAALFTHLVSLWQLSKGAKDE
jgi:hypothetical protein